MQSTISSKWQITIPSKLRRKLKLQPGMKLEFDEDAAFLSASPAFDEGKMQRWVGAAKDFEPDKSAKDVLREMRGHDEA